MFYEQHACAVFSSTQNGHRSHLGYTVAGTSSTHTDSAFVSARAMEGWCPLRHAHVEVDRVTSANPETGR